MANQGFGAGEGSGADDFDALARQYWSQWGEMLRAGAQAASGANAAGGVPGAGFPGGAFAGMGMPGSGMPGMGFPGNAFSAAGIPGAGFGFAGKGFPGTGFGGAGFGGAGFGGAGFPGAGAPGASSIPGWNEAVAWWAQVARGTANAQADATLDRFAACGQDWYARMQALAAQFAGQQPAAADIAAAWKRALGGDAANPFAEMLSGMQGPGQQGFDAWFAQVAPWLEQLQQGGQQWLGAPTFGFAREHQERWQHLVRAQLDHQQQMQGYQALMGEAAQDAFKRFEEKLAAHTEAGSQLESARALFDLWIDAAEDAYAEVAMSPRFRDAYGLLVNAQMRLRAAVQREIEKAGEALGVPTRTEMDASHRKVVQLEREVRQLRDQLAELLGSQGAAAAGEAPRTAGSDRARPRPPAKAAAKAVPAERSGATAAKRAARTGKGAAVDRAPAAGAGAGKSAIRKSIARKSATGAVKSATRKSASSKSDPSKSDPSKSDSSKSARSAPGKSAPGKPAAGKPVARADATVAKSTRKAR